MDSFEQVISSVLQRRGYWTMTSVKVELTREDKRAIGRPNAPRWELDVIGYQGRDNHLLVLECKSFLDSLGVQVRTFAGKNAKDRGTYKLFFDDDLRRVVLHRLVEQFVLKGLCKKGPKVTFGLAAGKIMGDEIFLRDHFQRKGWELWTPSIIRDELKLLRHTMYENSVVAVVAKVLLRGSD